jgi:phosphoribosylamine--glycine ligase
MKILVIGGGGREHALAWKLAESPKATKVYVAPGNGGTALAGGKLENLDITDVKALREWAQAEKIAVTVVGPRLRWRPAWSMSSVPTDSRSSARPRLQRSWSRPRPSPRTSWRATASPRRNTKPSPTPAAHAYVDRLGAPIVIKADGLAAGKGVVVAMSLQEAHDAVDFMLVDNKYGVQHNEGGARVVIEEFLEGEEASFIVLCDGKNVLALATSQDHKRLKDGDQGPNTGGMGAYSPAPVVTADVHARAMREIILPTIRGMEKDGVPYTGFLYAGLMIDKAGHPKTLEFNCRMGDPETQPIMMRLKSDLVDVMLAACEGKLDQLELQWDRRTALGVVMAAAGYPEDPRKGDVITGLPAAADDAMVFHAGTQLGDDGQPVTSGGRVLCVTVLADSVKQAQQKVYDVARGIHFDGAQYRRDIGFRAVKKAD